MNPTRTMTKMTIFKVCVENEQRDIRSLQYSAGSLGSLVTNASLFADALTHEVEFEFIIGGGGDNDGEEDEDGHDEDEDNDDDGDDANDAVRHIMSLFRGALRCLHSVNVFVH